MQRPKPYQAMVVWPFRIISNVETLLPVFYPPADSTFSVDQLKQTNDFVPSATYDSELVIYNKAQLHLVLDLLEKNNILSVLIYDEFDATEKNASNNSKEEVTLTAREYDEEKLTDCFDKDRPYLISAHTKLFEEIYRQEKSTMMRGTALTLSQLSVNSQLNLMLSSTTDSMPLFDLNKRSETLEDKLDELMLEIMRTKKKIHDLNRAHPRDYLRKAAAKLKIPMDQICYVSNDQAESEALRNQAYEVVDISLPERLDYFSIDPKKTAYLAEILIKTLVPFIGFQKLLADIVALRPNDKGLSSAMCTAIFEYLIQENKAQVLNANALSIANYLQKHRLGKLTRANIIVYAQDGIYVTSSHTHSVGKAINRFFEATHVLKPSMSAIGDYVLQLLLQAQSPLQQLVIAYGVFTAPHTADALRRKIYQTMGCLSESDAKRHILQCMLEHLEAENFNETEKVIFDEGAVEEFHDVLCENAQIKNLLNAIEHAGREVKGSIEVNVLALYKELAFMQKDVRRFEGDVSVEKFQKGIFNYLDGYDREVKKVTPSVIRKVSTLFIGNDPEYLSQVAATYNALLKFVQTHFQKRVIMLAFFNTPLCTNLQDTVLGVIGFAKKTMAAACLRKSLKKEFELLITQNENTNHLSKEQKENIEKQINVFVTQLFKESIDPICHHVEEKLEFPCKNYQLAMEALIKLDPSIQDKDVKIQELNKKFEHALSLNPFKE